MSICVIMVKTIIILASGRKFYIYGQQPCLDKLQMQYKPTSAPVAVDKWMYPFKPQMEFCNALYNVLFQLHSTIVSNKGFHLCRN